ncbi:uncharacterized protein SAPINGB_P003717 [Magnusiomyces paraingens]|uniref:[RNA-polymerase]-subunit kinase n=1 Tax=Magnusiomyces paraingens TaxID=2606893 RepID=A0A5E8BQV4_9ASCO|nr:uncharacterized protein SAPINGB_P003717 [Saprochaete ingens]VVT53723.1 unnamed protein product [Saprochaete ingens]
MEKYTKERKVGEGTYAEVYVGRDQENGRLIAIKALKVTGFKEGLDMSAIREIKFLQEIRHRNVIELIDVFATVNSISLVLEYLPADLEMLIKDKSLIFKPADVKSWLLMTLRGLHHCHRSFVLHRDLKPNNLLVAPDGQIKLADFGLARAMAVPREAMTPLVVTRWYRAPELCLGARFYTGAIDIWSVGAIFAELMLRTPYLPGEDDAKQAILTFKALGTPTEQTWPGITQLDGYKSLEPSIEKFPAPRRADLQHLFLAASDTALDLLQGMLTLCPSKRLNTKQALKSPYFVELPRATKPEDLPRKAPSAVESEGDSEERKRREEMRQNMINQTRERRMQPQVKSVVN